MSATIVRRVVDWYREAQRPLPWRAQGTSPWGVLVSEFMCQQTQVDRVVPRWLEWMARWPTPSALADASPADAIRAWDRLGYPRRARWLHAAAREIADRHADAVPSDTESLRALTGVGEYTAAAVQAFAFGMPSVVLDTNVRRVIARAVTGEALPPPSVRTREREVAADLVAIAQADAVGGAAWSQSVMELGALVCTSRAPACATCPVTDACVWVAAGRPAADGPRRTQARYEGSDRQARGTVLALLRDASRAVPASHVEDALADAARRQRAITSLIADGLIVETSAGDYRLPG